ncbi:hypothetical protein ACFLSP_04815 [Bacteroidota bacterium]
MKQNRIFHLFSMAVLSSFLFASVNAMAPKKVDFSGEWILNESKSELGEGRFRLSSELTVKQEGNTLTIERTVTGRGGETRTTSETLTMDGKENVSESENRSSTTTVKWSDDSKSLTITSDLVMSRQGETFKVKRTEIWTMDKDGKILTIKSSSSSSRGDRSVTLIYDKK